MRTIDIRNKNDGVIVKIKILASSLADIVNYLESQQAKHIKNKFGYFVNNYIKNSKAMIVKFPNEYKRLI